jgi:hypothetical protein
MASRILVDVSTGSSFYRLVELSLTFDFYDSEPAITQKLVAFDEYSVSLQQVKEQKLSCITLSCAEMDAFIEAYQAHKQDAAKQYTAKQDAEQTTATDPDCGDLDDHPFSCY